MEYILKFIRKHYVVLLSFIIPVAILEIAYLTWGIYPFGKATVLIIDLFHQYAPFLLELQHKLRNFTSLFYSWTGGLGTGFLPLYAYYLASPLNILTVLFPKSLLSEMVLFLVLLKAGLSGAFFSVFLGKRYKKKDLATVAFSLAYALSGFLMAYSWNIMWLDCIYLLPLVIMGLDKLIRENRGILYAVTLGLALYANFYTAFFICFFTLLYYPVCLFRYKGFREVKTLFKRTIKFGGMSLMGAGLAAVLLIPTAYALRLTSAAGDTFPREFIQYYDLFDYAGRHFVLATPSIWEGMPNLYASISLLIFLPMYFLSAKIPLREKLLNGFLLLVLMVSFNFNMLDFIWHGFHFPNQLPFRFSFVYIFFVLTLGYEGYRRIGEYTRLQVGAICTSVLVAVILSQKLNGDLIDIYVLYGSTIFIVVYGAVLNLNKKNKDMGKSFVKMVFLFAIVVELLVNTVGSVWRIGFDMGYTSREEYITGGGATLLKERIKAIEEEDESFYRMEVLPRKTANDPFLYGYRGLSIFSSTFPYDPVKMMDSFGYHSNGVNSYNYESSTIFLDSFFGIKYVVYRKQNITEKLYTLIGSEGEIIAYENPHVLPLGIHGTQKLESFNSRSINPFAAQNSLAEKFCGVGDIFNPMEHKLVSQSNLTFTSSGPRYYRYKRSDASSKSTVTIKVDIKESSQVYLYLKLPPYKIKEGFVMLGEKKVEFDADRSTLVNLGYLEGESGPLVTLVFKDDAPESGEFEFYAHGLDFDRFTEARGAMEKRGFIMDTFKDGYVTGHINAPEDGIMVFTIPYDLGWNVFVDDIKVNTWALDGGLLSFELEEGYHDIKLRYVPEGFPLGAGISAMSLLIICIGVLRKW